MLSLVLHEIRVRRRTILGWTIGLAFFAAMYMAFYPALPDELRNMDMESIDIYKSMGIQTMATFDGYMQSTVFNFLPLLVATFALLLGTGALAGEEDAGTIENLAALPISRVQLYSAKAVAVIVAAFFAVLAAGSAVAVAFLVVKGEIDTSVTALDLFWVMLAHWLIAFVFLSLGLCLGALLPSRGMANAVASVVLVLAFFGNSLAGMVTELETAQPLSPFHYFAHITQSLIGDVPWDDVSVLVAMGLGALVLGAVGFRRRDLTVGSWGWLRAPRGDRSVGGALGTLRTRRVIASLAVLGLAGCACGSVGAIGWATSEDLRREVRDRLAIDDEDVVSASGELVEGRAPVPATAGGRVVTIEVDAGDVVEPGDVLVVLADAGESAVRSAAQDVLERAWALLDEMAAGTANADVDDLAAAVERARTVADAADRAWRETQLAGGSAVPVDELESRAAFAWTAQRIAEARLALAEGDLSDADIQAVQGAVEAGRSYLTGTSAAPALRAVRAPLGGTVAAILVIADEAVSEGQTLAQITDRGSREVVIHLAKGDAGRIKVGSDANVEVDEFDDPFDGAVVEIVEVGATAIADDGDGDGEASLPFMVRIAVDDPKGELEAGMGVDVRFDLG